MLNYQPPTVASSKVVKKRERSVDADGKPIPNKCSICKQFKHTARNCPSKPEVVAVAAPLDFEADPKPAKKAKIVVAEKKVEIFVKVKAVDSDDEVDEKDEVEQHNEVLYDEKGQPLPPGEEHEVDAEGDTVDKSIAPVGLEWSEEAVAAPTFKETRGKQMKESFPFFSGADPGPKNLGDAETPMDFLDLLWTDEIMDTFVRETNSFGANKHGPEWVPTTVRELQLFWAVVQFMGLVQTSSRRKMWSPNSIQHQPVVRNLFTLKRFDRLAKCIHWIDASRFTAEDMKARQAGSTFWRVNGFLNTLSRNFENHWNPGARCDVDIPLAATTPTNPTSFT